MSYRELVVELDAAHAEAFSDALLELGALSVSVEDADADTPDEQPLFGEPGQAPGRAAWRRSRVIALLAQYDPMPRDSAQHSPVQRDPAQLVAAAAGALGLAGAPAFTLREVEEQDWVRVTQAQFEPIPVGQRIWVVPSWHDAPDSGDPNAPDPLVLELDPGLAFGTGSHPTTRLCMEWLEQFVKPGQSVLDYGCGSGILAILASKCGAHPVVGIDIDPQAVEAARHNSERNRANVVYGLPNTCSALGAQGDARAEFDIVVANILSSPLKLMASMLASRVKPGGRIALSGVLARQANEVARAYAPWINLAVWRELDGWVCLAGARNS